MSCSGSPARSAMPPPSPVQVCADVQEKIRAAVAARRQDHGVRAEAMQLARRHVERHDAAARAVFHDQVDGEVFDEEARLVLERLLVQRVQHRVAGAVRRGAGALRDALAVMRRHAAERALVDPAVLGARERQAVVLEFEDRRRRFLAHELDRVLVAEPVRALDGVVEVEAPVVLAHVAERCADAALRGDRVAARREHLADARRVEALLGETEGGTKSGAAGADDDDVVGMIGERVIRSGHAWAPNAMRNTARMPIRAATTSANLSATSTTRRVPLSLM